MFPATGRTILRKALSVNLIPVAFKSKSAPELDDEISYYQMLGISPRSTQTEIKAAYYKLSMTYHPDRNENCAISAQKFREVTQAYEILGNQKLRKLYDKGVIKTDLSVISKNEADVKEEKEVADPITKFYRSRMHSQTQRTVQSSNTYAFNFDSWTRAHYGDTISRRTEARNRWERNKHDERIRIGTNQNHFLLFAMITLTIGTYGIFYIESSHDTPRSKTSFPTTKESNLLDPNSK